MYDEKLKTNRDIGQRRYYFMFFVMFYYTYIIKTEKNANGANGSIRNWFTPYRPMSTGLWANLSARFSGFPQVATGPMCFQYTNVYLLSMLVLELCILLGKNWRKSQIYSVFLKKKKKNLLDAYLDTTWNLTFVKACMTCATNGQTPSVPAGSLWGAIGRIWQIWCEIYWKIFFECFYARFETFQAVYGVLSSFEGCQAFKDMENNTKIGEWYAETKEAVKNRLGAQEFMLEWRKFCVFLFFWCFNGQFWTINLVFGHC